MAKFYPLRMLYFVTPWLMTMLLLGACNSPQLSGMFQAEKDKTSTVTAKEATKTAVENSKTPLYPWDAQASTMARPSSASRQPYKPVIQGTPQKDAQKAKKPMPSLAPYLYKRHDSLRRKDQTASLPSAPPPPLPKSSTVRVALLLPLSGRSAKLGIAMQNAAQLAMFAFANEKFELLVHDTKGTAQGAVDAAALAIGDGARLILGPLLRASVRAVAPSARAANVTVVAFSSDMTVAGEGIYTMGFYPEAEVTRVVAFARSRGIARFAALAPDNEGGDAVVEALKRAVEGTDAVISRIKFYDPDSDDFSAVVRDLANYDQRRQTLLEQRATLKERSDDLSKRALERLDKLQTIGDLPFDALLLADGGKRLQSVAALLPFYDIDPAKIRILGTGRWDVAGIGAEPAMLGGWFAAPSLNGRLEFEKQYQNVYGKKPPRLATLAYDATALAAVLAQAESGADFSARALTDINGFLGRDGIFRFLDGGTVERGLAVIKVLERGVKVIDKAPQTF